MEEKTPKTLRDMLSTPVNQGPTRLGQMTARRKEELVQQHGLREQVWAELVDHAWNLAVSTVANSAIREEIKQQGIEVNGVRVQGVQAYSDQFATADAMTADLEGRIVQRVIRLQEEIKKNPPAPEYQAQVQAVVAQVRDRISSAEIMEEREALTGKRANALYQAIGDEQTRQMHQELDALRSELVAELEKEGRFSTKALEILKKYSLPALGGVLVGAAVYAAMPPEVRDNLHDLASSLIQSLEHYMEHQAETKMDTHLSSVKSALQKQLMGALGVEFNLDLTKDDQLMGLVVEVVRAASLSGLIDVSELMQTFSEAAVKAKNGSEVITVGAALTAIDQVLQGREAEYATFKESTLYRQLSTANPGMVMPLPVLRQQMEGSANTLDGLRTMLNVEAEIYKAEQNKPWHEKLRDRGRQAQHMAVAVGKAVTETAFNAADNLLMTANISMRMAGEDAGKALKGIAEAEQQVVGAATQVIKQAEQQVLHTVQALDKAGKTLANQIAPETQRPLPGLAVT